MTVSAPSAPTAVIATGAYTSASRGRGRGVTLWALDRADLTMRELATVELEDPSFLLWSEDGTLLHVVQETSPTRLTTLRVAADGAGAEVLGDLELTGSGGCHAAPGLREGTLVVTDYASGHVEVVRLDEEGRPVAVLDVCDQDSYRPAREGHPHQAVVLPGTELLAVSDLGMDRVYLYKQDSAGTIDLTGEISAPRFSGPRHLAADHESRTVYVACELSGQIVDFTRIEATAEQPGPAFSAGRPLRASGRDGENRPSHIEVSRHENHLFVANRGPDTISAFSLGMMRPELVSEIEVGAEPRHFARVAELMLVAAQEGDRIDVLRWDGMHLGTAADPVPAPSVTCIAPRP